jgi:hypothetical protein
VEIHKDYNYVFIPSRGTALINVGRISIGLEEDEASSFGISNGIRLAEQCHHPHRGHMLHDYLHSLM